MIVCHRIFRLLSIRKMTLDKSIFSNQSIDIIPFEPRFQNEVEQLFRDGLSPKTYDKGPTVAGSQRWFVSSKLSREKNGDMYDIYKSYMTSDNENDSSSNVNHFWVAYDNTKDVVVGHVGLIMSTYKKEDAYIYQTPDLSPLNVCELVRMGVHTDYRGMGIGKRLCETLEKYAFEKGMKQIVLSTLEKMELARRMYEKYGFKLVHKTKIPISDLLGPGDWEELYVVHYVKCVQTY